MRISNQETVGTFFLRTLDTSIYFIDRTIYKIFLAVHTYFLECIEAICFENKALKERIAKYENENEALKRELIKAEQIIENHVQSKEKARKKIRSLQADLKKKKP